MVFMCNGVCEGKSQDPRVRKYSVRKFCSVCDTWVKHEEIVGIRCPCCNTKCRQGKKRKGHTSPEVARL
uniref:Uncharacterized protein n=1 Tax=Nitrosopumivirus cobalaminus TaxID=3158414 RepID=A0AAU7N4A9_9VIRU